MSFGKNRTTPDELSVLRNSALDCGAGYFGVYPARDGWVAKAFKRRISPVCATPTQAAAYAVHFWKTLYGDDWAAVFHGRKAEGWTIIPSPGGYRVLVNIVRTPGLVQLHPPGSWYVVPVPPPPPNSRPLKRRRKRNRDRFVSTAERSPGADYDTVADAKAALREWKRARFGLFASCVGLWLRRRSFKCAPQVAQIRLLEAVR